MNFRHQRYGRRNGYISQRKFKSKKFLTQNIQDIWDIVRRPNLRIIGIEEREESQLKGPESIFNKIKEEYFSNLMKDMPTKV